MGHKRKSEQQLVDLEDEIKRLKSEMEKLQQKNRDSESSDDRSVVDNKENTTDDSEGS